MTNTKASYLNVSERCSAFWYSSHLFPHSPPLRIVLPVDGDDGMGWIFNRFVSGSTMGGGIVVNIITYRSLRLNFPRPCHTGPLLTAVKPSSSTTTTTISTHTHTLFAMTGCDSACLHGFTLFISYDPFNLPYILPLHNLVLIPPYLFSQSA